VRMAQSIMDYIFRRLALDYLSFDERSALGIYSAEERQRHLETGSYEPLVGETGSASELVEAKDAIELETKDTHGAESRQGPAAPATGQAHTSAELLEKLTGTAVDSPLCMTCGTKMRPAGSCYVCEGCGSTSGCS
jgi:ribonucleoside-diphosphate reductase alpha chain